MSTPEISVNGQQVGTLPVSSFFFLDLPAGHHVVTAALDAERRVSFFLAAGETRYVKTSVHFGGAGTTAVIELRTPSLGAADVAVLKYTGGTAS